MAQGRKYQEPMSLIHHTGVRGVPPAARPMGQRWPAFHGRFRRMIPNNPVDFRRPMLARPGLLLEKYCRAWKFTGRPTSFFPLSYVYIHSRSANTCRIIFTAEKGL